MDRQTYLSLAVLLFAQAELFVQFLVHVDGIMRYISVKLFEFGPLAYRRCHLKIFFLYLALVAMLFSGSKPLVQFWYRALSGIFL